MRLTSTGLGIGTSSPAYKLDVSTAGTSGARVTTAEYGQFVLTDGTRTVYLQNYVGVGAIGTASNNALTFAVNNTERARIDTSGNLGIGTSSPTSYANFIYTTINGTNGAGISLRNTAGTTLSEIYQNSTGLGIASVSNLPILFLTNNTERARIDSSGNLLVGQTGLNVSALGASIQGSSGTTPGSISCAIASSSSSATTYNVYSTTAGAYRFYVDMTGTVHATSIVITAISDQRLKENVRDIDTGLNAIMALKPRRFDWKEGKGQDKKNAAGFIAQEFETVFPECVSTSKAGEDGIEYKNINHETLIPTLVKAMQEQQALIESLTKRLADAGIA
jgi:hypothetical protein